MPSVDRPLRLAASNSPAATVVLPASVSVPAMKNRCFAIIRPYPCGLTSVQYHTW